MFLKDCKAYYGNNPRPSLAIMLTCGNMLDKLLHEKIYLSGAAWRRQNDSATMKGEPRQFKMVEKASNKSEYAVGRTHVRLLNDSTQWLTLRHDDFNLKNASLAFRLIVRQAAATVINLVIPHRQCPDAFVHDLLSGDNETIANLKQTPTCMMDDWVYEHCEEHGKERIDEPDSIATTYLVADEGITATVRSECGHSFWQREARCRSLQTHSDSFITTNATHMLHRQRMIERENRMIG